MLTIRARFMALFVLLLLLAPVTGASAASTNRVAGLEATIHGAAHLELHSCVYLSEDGGALFQAFIENAGASEVQGFRVTLHGYTGDLVAERTYATLLPGDSKVFAVRLSAEHSAAVARAGGTSCVQAS